MFSFPLMPHSGIIPPRHGGVSLPPSPHPSFLEELKWLIIIAVGANRTSATHYVPSSSCISLAFRMNNALPLVFGYLLLPETAFTGYFHAMGVLVCRPLPPCLSCP